MGRSPEIYININKDEYSDRQPEVARKNSAQIESPNYSYKAEPSCGLIRL